MSAEALVEAVSRPSLTKRMSGGVEFHAAYTWSRSKDLFSADPGSTAGSGRPDEPVVTNTEAQRHLAWFPDIQALR